MNGMDLSDKLAGLNKAELRRIWTAAVRELGWTTQKALAYVDFDSTEPRHMAHTIVWQVYCAKRVATKTGGKVWSPPSTVMGVGRMVDETTCSWAESDAAVARVFAAVGK